MGQTIARQSAARKIHRECAPWRQMPVLDGVMFLQAPLPLASESTNRFGEVLVACYFHDDYQRIRSLIQDDGRSEASALRMVLGFAYNDFGVEVANQWELPHTIAQGMRATAHTSPSVLASITAFSHELTATLYQTDNTSSVGPAREVLLGAESEQSVLRLRELNAAARRAFGASLALPDDGATPTILAEPDVTVRARLRHELDDVIDPASGATIGTVLLQAMEVITRGGPVVALTQQRQALYLPTDRTMHTMEQRWANEQDVSQFGVFPLVVLGKVIGCLYCDRLGSGPAPDRATVRYTKSIADLVVDAIARRRT